MLAGLLHDIGALSIIRRAEDLPELAQDEEIFEDVIESLLRCLAD